MLTTTTISWDKPVGRESARAFEYFVLYRDMTASERSLRQLAEVEVNGTKTGWTQLGRWSSHYEWQERVRDYDLHISNMALIEARQQHEGEIRTYTENLFTTSKAFNAAVMKKLAWISKLPAEDMPCADLRQLALTFDISNRWLCQLIGIQEGPSG